MRSSDMGFVLVDLDSDALRLARQYFQKDHVCLRRFIAIDSQAERTESVKRFPQAPEAGVCS
jgi:hypothetical protein